MPDLQGALLGALDAVSGELDGLATRIEAWDDVPREVADDPRAREQFIRAFVALLREGVEGGREQRDLVMRTAVPALVHAGQSRAALVHAHVAFFMALAPRMLDRMPAELRDEGALWLARYAADYTREVLEIAEGEA